ncbi:MAG: LacI family DNA-binding transcriptional regulator [Chloroflexi bacterium]|nr:LacI family DNA-binding transcriptional regulator [Chloroflexota bacterium]
MATMKDVAQAAGVSVTTVSHVINETRYVSEELRERVLKAMEDLHYHPNTLARSLRQGISHTIGLIVPDNANPFFADVARVVETHGFKAGYSTILCNSDGQLEKELTYVNVLLAKKVDGVIFIAANSQSEHIALLTEQKIPVVIADRHMPDVEVDVVLVDNYRGGYLATEYLISLGHHRIGCITGPSDTTPGADRVRGYKDALTFAGLPIDKNLIVRGDFRYAGGASGAQKLLDLKEPPTAIFACNDAMAMAAMAVIRERGLAIPDDISIVGFDDIPQASFTSPPLTTVAQPIQDIGRIATDLLIERMSGSTSRPYQRIILDVKLVIRGSCAPRRTGDD